mgnify:CR=1 FL=1|jgi:ubiquitin C-terminal hydrolase
MTRAEIFDYIGTVAKAHKTTLKSLSRYMPYSITTDSLQVYFSNEGPEFAKKLCDSIRKTNDESLKIDANPLPKRREELRSSVRGTGFEPNPNTVIILEIKGHSFPFFDVEEKSDSDDDANKTKGYDGSNKHSGSTNLFSHKSYEKKACTKSERSMLGRVGLKNLGNTCYMNSALQCLSHTRELSRYFLDKDFENDLNPNNPLGSSCKLVKAYAELVNQMWYGEEDRVSPSDFKYEMGKFQSLFEGYGQHDSQELLSRLLDGLHEDLNLIQKKPYTEDKDYSEKEDNAAVATTFWINFLKRNYSKITSLFYGQYRTQCKCPDCDHTSVKYDPFELVSLPIPVVVSHEFTLSAFDITLNHNKQASKAIFRIKSDSKNEPTVQNMMEAYAKAKESNLSWEHYFIAFSGFGTHGDYISTTTKLTDVFKRSQEDYYRPKLFLFERSPEEVVRATNPDCITVFCHQILKEDWNNRNGEQSYPGFTKIVPVLPTNTIQELYWFIFQKFMHYVNVEVLKGEPEQPGLTYPRPVANPQELFEFCKNKKFATLNFPFKITISDKDYAINDQTTIGSIVNQISVDKISKAWEEKHKVMKIQLWLDPDIIQSNLVAIPAMKKVSPDEISVEVSLKNKTEDHEEEKKNTLYTLIKKFTQPETLDENNLYRCSNCKKEVQGLRQIRLYKLPKYLIIHMKKLKGGFDWRNLDKGALMVDFPVDNLDMTDIVIDKKPIECYNIDKKEFMDAGNAKLEKKLIEEFNWPEGKKLIYNCYGVINHYGSMHFGHYTAYAKNNGKWYCYDDSTVTPISDPKNIVTEAAYVLFYERVD